MMNDDFRVRFGKTANGKRQAALVTIKNGDHIFFGISKCHPKKDTFDKRLAVEIAYGRAQKILSDYTIINTVWNGNFSIIGPPIDSSGAVLVSRANELVEHFYKFTKSHRSKQ